MNKMGFIDFLALVERMLGRELQSAAELDFVEQRWNDAKDSKAKMFQAVARCASVAVLKEMNNLNSFGAKHLATYLRDYAAGEISFKSVCLYIGCCFDDRGGK